MAKKKYCFRFDEAEFETFCDNMRKIYPYISKTECIEQLWWYFYGVTCSYLEDGSKRELLEKVFGGTIAHEIKSREKQD